MLSYNDLHRQMGSGWHYIWATGRGGLRRFGSLSPSRWRRIRCALSGWTTHRSRISFPLTMGKTTSTLWILT